MRRRNNILKAAKAEYAKLQEYRGLSPDSPDHSEVEILYCCKQAITLRTWALRCCARLNVLVWWSFARFTQDHRSVHSLDHILLCRRHRAIFFQTHLLQRTPVHFFTFLKRQILGLLRVQHLERVSLDAGIFGRLLLRFLLRPPLLCLTQQMNFGAHRRRPLLCLLRADTEALYQTQDILGVKEMHFVLHYGFPNRNECRLALGGQGKLYADVEIMVSRKTNQNRNIGRSEFPRKRVQ